MGSINQLKGKIVYLDTAPLIYFIEKHTAFSNVVTTIFDSHARGEFLFVTSVLTLSEVLSQPILKKKVEIERDYEHILTNSDNFELFDIRIREAKTAALLRSVYRISLPDAIQLATAIEAKADLFLTNDEALRKVSEVKVLTLSDF